MEEDLALEAELAGYPAELWASMSDRERRVARARAKSSSAPDTDGILSDVRASVM
jgi:hypothetical protein